MKNDVITLHVSKVKTIKSETFIKIVSSVEKVSSAWVPALPESFEREQAETFMDICILKLKMMIEKSMPLYNEKIVIKMIFHNDISARGEFIKTAGSIDIVFLDNQLEMHPKEKELVLACLSKVK